MISKASWVLVGYEIFSLKGDKELKVEDLARKVGISKSSFYHHFADMEYFIEELLKHHLNQTQIIAQKEKSANKIDPDLINILIEHKTDLLFNRQLRVNRENKLYSNILARSNEVAADYFIDIWQRDLNMKFTKQQLDGAFNLALENFYLQITYENINKDWLSNYFAELKSVLVRFA